MNVKPISDAMLAKLDLHLIEQPGCTINYSSIRPEEYAALRERLRLVDRHATGILQGHGR